MTVENKPARRCRGVIRFGDDEGDNDCTMRCQLLSGHTGEHEEKGDIPTSVGWTQPYVVRWRSARRVKEAEHA